ncbi:unnamed protein product, partial [marine sediment metagenome]
MNKRIKVEPNFYYYFGSKLENQAVKLIKKVDKFKEVDWKKSTDRELVKALEEVTDFIAYFVGGGIGYSFYFFFNDILIERL